MKNRRLGWCKNILMMDCEQNMLVDCVPHTTNECYNEATQIVFIFEIETKTAYHQWECFQAQKGTKCETRVNKTKL